MTARALAAAPRAGSQDEGGRRVSVLLVDDEELVHWGFRLLLGHQPWAERCLPASDAGGALELAHRFEPHVALVDPGALGGDVAGFARDMARTSPRTQVLLLTQAEVLSPGTVRAAGAVGYVSRSWPVQDMLRAIRSASAGLAVAPPRMAGGSTLSVRQQEVLQRIAAGATNAEIAVDLFLSCHTVKQHTSALYRKLNVRNRTHAVQAAQQQGLIAV